MNLYILESLLCMMQSYFRYLSPTRIIAAVFIALFFVCFFHRYIHGELIIQLLWVLYITCLLLVTVFGRKFGGTTNNLTTILDFSDCFSDSFQIWKLYDLIFNVVLFIPCGILIGQYSVSLWRKIRFVFFLSLGVEIIQLTFGVGQFELSDLLNNSLGGAIGICLFGIFSIIRNRVKRSDF